MRRAIGRRGYRVTPKQTRNFWAKVDTSGACWEWRGGRVNGYGRFNIDGKQIGAHRVSYELAHGSIPAGLDILHACDNPGCVNPAHLRPGTQLENMHDARNKGRQLVKLTADDAKAIRNARALGLTFQEIANHFNISYAMAYKVVRGERWSHVK